MNMNILRNRLILILIIMLAPYVCIALALQQAEKTKYFDDAGEFLFPQIEKPFDDVENQSIINPGLTIKMKGSSVRFQICPFPGLR